MSTRETRRREQTQQRLTIVRSTITKSIAGIGDDDLDQALLAARATGGVPLRELANHLEGHPDALVTGAADGPKALFRLLGHLADAGQPVTLPRCSSCGKETADLPRFADSGRICPACGAKNSRQDCDRCGRTKTRIFARRADGGICESCYRTDPDRIEPCARCGRQQNAVSRLADGRALCQRCWTPPQHQCARCGHIGKAVSRGADGPLCAACYRRYRRPRKLCGRCGRIRLLAYRGKNGEPDLCESCYTGPSHLCGRCGRNRPGHRDNTGQWICKTCTPRTPRICSRCGRSRPVSARLPRGPVCSACYDWLHYNPAACAGCHELHVLIGLDERGAICGPCAGSTHDPRCRTCGQPGRHHTGGKCARCVLADRVDELLTGPDGLPNAELAPVRELLLATDSPYGQIVWISRSKAAQLLRELASHGGHITHVDIDALPLGQHEMFLRQLLVQAGVLPPRNDDLERIPPWLDTLLADQPEHRSRLIRPFAHWFVLRRARRSAARRRHPTQAGAGLRTRIRVALEFLTWLDTMELDLAAASQAVLEQWLARGNTRSYDIRYFLSWASSRGLAQDLHVPVQP